MSEVVDVENSDMWMTLKTSLLNYLCRIMMHEVTMKCPLKAAAHNARLIPSISFEPRKQQAARSIDMQELSQGPYT